MNSRTNEEWLLDLRRPGQNRDDALSKLRDYLLRSVLVYLSRRRSDLTGWTAEMLRQFAEDMVQEAILDIEHNLGQFRVDSKFTTWTYLFVINRAAGELRHSRYGDYSFESLQEEEHAFFSAVVAESTKTSPEDLVEQQEMVDLLHELMRQGLTTRQRDAIVRVHFQGQSMERVAEKLNINRNALYKLLYDARQKLKAELKARHLSVGDVLAPFED
jgi:RNA polymerase sigma-70 factor (ECF subfamily)